MSRYFNKFPTLFYPQGDNFKLAVDILRRVGFNESFKNNFNASIEYIVKDGEKPENIAAKFYGTPNLVWIIFLMNDIIDPYHDWALSDRQLEDFITEKHGETGGNDIGQVRLKDSGIIIDIDDPLLFEDGAPFLMEGGLLEGEWLLVHDIDEVEGEVITLSNRQVEIENNEKKRRIQLLKPRFVEEAIQQLEQKIV